MLKTKIMGLALATAVAAGTAGATARVTESLDNWTVGKNAPVIEEGLRADGSTGKYMSVPVGTDPFYYEILEEGEGSVTMWIYDPGTCLSSTNPGYPNLGPRWGMQSPLYQSMTVGMYRATYMAGCQGYSPWSTVAPYSAGWFKDGVRGSMGFDFTPGWYKWTITATWDDITFTLHDVAHEIQDGAPHDDPADITTGDVSITYDAASMGGMWEAIFGEGWKAVCFAGDADSGIENIKIDIVSGTGIFSAFGAGDPTDTVVIVDPDPDPVDTSVVDPDPVPVIDGRVTESLDGWMTVNTNAPVIGEGLRADGSTGKYMDVPIATRAFYYEVPQAGEGSITMWVYDPANCLAVTDPGYGSNGPKWGLMNDMFQAVTVGISRQSYVAGCQGYSPWSTVAPYSHYWYQNGVRGHDGVPFSSGWYKWTINAGYDFITFTLHDVDYMTDGGVVEHGDVSKTYDASSFDGAWEAAFGNGWKALYIIGDGANGVENIKVDVVDGTGVFSGFAAKAQDEVVVEIPEEGGTVDSSTCPELVDHPLLKGLKLRFHDECLLKKISLSIKVKIDQKAMLAVDLTVDDLASYTFEAPVDIELPLSDAMLAMASSFALAYYNEDTGKWEEVAGCEVDLTAGVVRGSVSHFSTYGIIPAQNTTAVTDAPARDMAFTELPVSVSINPVNDRTELSFSLPTASRVTLGIWNVSGSLVRSMVRDLPAGANRMAWDTTDRNGLAVEPGLYICRVEAGSAVTSFTLQVIR